MIIQRNLRYLKKIKVDARFALNIKWNKFVCQNAIQNKKEVLGCTSHFLHTFELGCTTGCIQVLPNKFSINLIFEMKMLWSQLFFSKETIWQLFFTVMTRQKKFSTIDIAGGFMNFWFIQLVKTFWKSS